MKFLQIEIWKVFLQNLHKAWFKSEGCYNFFFSNFIISLRIAAKRQVRKLFDQVWIAELI